MSEYLEELARDVVNGYRIATLNLDNVKIGLEVLPDHDATPDDYDCYDAEDKERFDRHEWRFVTLRMMVESFGVTGQASVSAVELSFNGPKQEIHHLMASVLPDLFGEIRDGYINARDALDELAF